jgi:hypothetical protein
VHMDGMPKNSSIPAASTEPINLETSSHRILKGRPPLSTATTPWACHQHHHPKADEVLPGHARQAIRELQRLAASGSAGSDSEDKKACGA